jgi:hypothetical protein
MYITIVKKATAAELLLSATGSLKAQKVQFVPTSSKVELNNKVSTGLYTPIKKK